MCVYLNSRPNSLSFALDVFFSCVLSEHNFGMRTLTSIIKIDLATKSSQGDGPSAVIGHNGLLMAPEINSSKFTKVYLCEDTVPISISVGVEPWQRKWTNPFHTYGVR